MWTAVALGSIIVGEFVAYGAWTAAAVRSGADAWPFVLGVPLVYLALPFLFTCIWMALGWWWRSPAPPTVALSFGGALRLFANEFASLAVSPVRMVLYRVLLPDPPPAPAALPVLLVHGVGCNAGVWRGLARDLAARGVTPLYTLSYGPPLASIELFADQLAAKIAAIRAATGAAQVVIVTHSMGGLVARAYLRRHGGAHVRRLVTLGAPHFGSRHAWLMFGTSLAQMRPGNAFLAGLNADGECAAGVPVVSLWSWHDSMVTPQTSARLPWAANVVIAGVAHNALLNDRSVWDLVAAEIAKARGHPHPNPLPPEAGEGG
ncbi:MAG: alpha/beta fold hydrolase [Burkholderiales bacterium]|nr:alpha/beta fold hydrolase [Burkholderiales bacterium]